MLGIKLHLRRGGCPSLALVALLMLSSANADERQVAEPLQTQTGVSPAEQEIRMFGKYLRAGEAADEGPFHTFNISMLVALYGVNGQANQVLRLCEYLESIAKTSSERQENRDCQRGALTKLGRYSEAESLAFADERWMPTTSKDNPMKQIIDWTWVAELSLNQGNTLAADRAYGKLLELAPSIQTWQPSFGTEVDPEVSKQFRDLLLDTLEANEITAQYERARIAYYQQRFDDYIVGMWTLLGNQNLAGKPNTWAVYAIEFADCLQLFGKTELARDIARQALFSLKADAGFRDQSEPLSRFETLPGITNAIGDERTQSMHVKAWTRLAKAYSILGRHEEADRLLAATEGLAKKYQLEPLDSSRLLAGVEEARSDQAARKKSWADAAALLRAARARLLKSSLTERSLEQGRRRNSIHSPLLQVDAKLLFVLTAGGTVNFDSGPGLSEAADIASDFSASRADLSAQLASRFHGTNSTTVRNLLSREGQLVDELVELREQLSARVGVSVADSGADRSISTRLSEIYGELERIKSELRTSDSNKPESTVGELQHELGVKQAYWQWISHPNANVVVCATASGISISRLTETYEALRGRVIELQTRVSLREVETFEQVKPFPMRTAYDLYMSLFGSIAERIEDTDHWIFAASSLVDGLPWGALRLNPNASETTSPNWLIERAALTVTPSWRTWLSLSGRPPSSGKVGLLAVGDPINTGGPVPLGNLRIRGAYIAQILARPAVDAPVDSAFAEEMKSVANLFSSSERKVLRGRHATKAELSRLKLSDYRILLFSTHGYLGSEFEMTIGPSLELTASAGVPSDRFLPAREIAKFELDADVVVLSACDTLASDGYEDSEGYSGLTSAFLLAGARDIVATLWPVETEATKTVVTRALRYYTAGGRQSMATALQLATIEVLSSGPSWMRHPAFWAPFLVVGR